MRGRITRIWSDSQDKPAFRELNIGYKGSQSKLELLLQDYNSLSDYRCREIALRTTGIIVGKTLIKTMINLTLKFEIHVFLGILCTKITSK